VKNKKFLQIVQKIRCCDEDELLSLRNELMSATGTVHAPSNPPIIVNQIISMVGSDLSSAILDYGCGGGMWVIYLRSLGYKNVFGIDVFDEDQMCELNSLYRKIFPDDSDVFYRYGGDRTPFDDGSFNNILSIQVVEHVANLEAYYNECSRLLVEEGQVLLDFPHLSVPFDTHAKLWFVHRFPKRIRRLFYDYYRSDAGGEKYYEKHLYFRSIASHKMMLVNDFDVKNITKNRLMQSIDYSQYKGNVMIRKNIDKLLSLPIIGYVFLVILSKYSVQTWLLTKRSPEYIGVVQ